MIAISYYLRIRENPVASKMMADFYTTRGVLWGKRKCLVAHLFFNESANKVKFF